MCNVYNKTFYLHHFACLPKAKDRPAAKGMRTPACSLA